MRALKSIRSKIVALAVLATLVPSFGLGWMSFQYNQGVIDEKVAHELRSLASYARRELDLWVQERVYDVRSLSASTVLIDGLAATAHRQAADRSGSRLDTSALTHYLRSVQSRLAHFQELTVVDAGGHIVASSTPSPMALPMPEAWPQNALTEGVVLAPPHWDAERASPTLALAVPVLSFDNEMLGALVAVIDLRALQPQLKGAANLPPGDVVVLDAKGQPLIGTLPVSERLMPLQPAVMQRLRARPGEPFAFRGFDQRTVIGVADTLREGYVTIVAERPRTEIYAAWQALRNQLLMLLTGLTLLVGLLAYAIGHATITPLRRLIGAAEQIAGGDLTVQLPAAQDDEVGRLTRAFNRMTDSLRHSHAEIEAASLALQQQNRMLEKLSTTDSLTGLHNRRKLAGHLDDHVARYRRNGRAFSVLMLDIDHFKLLNDRHGHQLGDEVLAHVARILVQSIRNVDFAARYGGEEFVIVLDESALPAALETAERIRATVAGAAYEAAGQHIEATVSVGVAEYREDDTAEAVIARADLALYQAKAAGRNQVHCSA